jgi:HSP20 family molecular chaperone IbpA
MVDNVAKKQFDGEVTQPESTRGGRVFVPNVDIIENENELLVVADVPGTKADQVEVTYEQGILTFHAQVQPRQKDGVQYLLQEYAVGDYERSFRLGKDIDPGKIEADIKDGVLTLHLPKAEQIKRKQITVKQA